MPCTQPKASTSVLSGEALEQEAMVFRKLCNLCVAQRLLFCGRSALLSSSCVRDNASSRRIRQEEMVAHEGSEVHDWICMLKHNSQTAMRRKGLGVGKDGE